MSDLPNWIYDVVMALQRWNEEHGELYMKCFGDRFVRQEGCCLALDLVPVEIRQQAKVIAEYQRRAEFDKASVPPVAAVALAMFDKGDAGVPSPLDELAAARAERDSLLTLRDAAKAWAENLDERRGDEIIAALVAAVDALTTREGA